jgi:hypothetical protein
LGRIAERIGDVDALFGAATVFLRVVRVGHYAFPHMPGSDSTLRRVLGS